jgi:hypothetical protein
MTANRQMSRLAVDRRAHAAGADIAAFAGQPTAGYASDSQRRDRLWRAGRPFTV